MPIVGLLKGSSMRRPFGEIWSIGFSEQNILSSVSRFLGIPNENRTKSKCIARRSAGMLLLGKVPMSKNSTKHLKVIIIPIQLQHEAVITAYLCAITTTFELLLCHTANSA
jgi:hypothetical protein